MLDRLYSPVEARTTIHRPRHDVFRTIADPKTYPTWLVGAQRIRHVDRAFPAPATSFDHSVGPTPEATVDDSSEVLAADPPRRLELQVHVGPVDAEVTFDGLVRVQKSVVDAAWVKPNFDLTPYKKLMVVSQGVSFRKLEPVSEF